MNNRPGWLLVSLLLIIYVILYYPVWQSTYLYTDESVQLWFYGKDPGFRMFASQGRYLTDLIFNFVFGKANRIVDVSAIRMVSFSGWLLVIPMWYWILKKVCTREGVNAMIAFLAVVFLICSPSLMISVAWASCMELFLAYTAGLLAGYLLYRGTRQIDGIIHVSGTHAAGAIGFGLISLFTYQNGIGSLFIPFLISYISPALSWRKCRVAIIFYLSISLVYFLVFKHITNAYGLPASQRTGIHVDIIPKLKFFFGRPLASAFHYTLLINENRSFGYIIYFILLAVWGVLFWIRNLNTARNIYKILVLLSILILVYLPSMIVKENYAANRTLLSLAMAITLLSVEMLFHFLESARAKLLAATTISLIFVVNGWYNLHVLFLRPQVNEYAQLRSFLVEHYKPGINTVYFIRPKEDFYSRKYGIARSWDEYGVPSTFFGWVPEFFVRQVLLEKTGSRELASSIIIKSWLGREEYIQAGAILPPGALLMDAEDILSGKKH